MAAAVIRDLERGVLRFTERGERFLTHLHRIAGVIATLFEETNKSALALIPTLPKKPCLDVRRFVAKEDMQSTFTCTLGLATVHLVAKSAGIGGPRAFIETIYLFCLSAAFELLRQMRNPLIDTTLPRSSSIIFAKMQELATVLPSYQFLHATFVADAVATHLALRADLSIDVSHAYGTLAFMITAVAIFSFVVALGSSFSRTFMKVTLVQVAIFCLALISSIDPETLSFRHAIGSSLETSLKWTAIIFLLSILGSIPAAARDA